MVNSKNKGSGFERTVCHLLSMWVSDSKHDDLFWRSAMSGGRATVVFKKGGQNRTQNGDITAIHPDGDVLTSRYLISCKFYRDLKIEGAVIGNKSGLSAFWTECVTESRQHNKVPMLISKQNNTPPFVCLDDVGTSDFGLRGKAIAQLPIAGGMQMFWLEKFLQTAKRPGNVRPRIKSRL